ncbi:hypothetical protein [Almyronema epifaneia]|uniref:Uncharacterized protein n=1 Tax=Almyronema epifaneia S1 TaxID=2991925 RepID=A0ABW6IAR2_9CYAN
MTKKTVVELELPWCVVRDLPNCTHRAIVARFQSRQMAFNYLSLVFHQTPHLRPCFEVSNLKDLEIENPFTSAIA